MDTNATRRIKRAGAGPKPLKGNPVYAHESRSFLFFLACSLFVHAVLMGSIWSLQQPGKKQKTIEIINVSVTSLPGPAGGGGTSEQVKPPPEKKIEEIPLKEEVKVASKLVEKKPPEQKKKKEPEKSEAPKLTQEAPRGPGQGPVGGGQKTEADVQGPVAEEGVNLPVLKGYLDRLKGRVDRDWRAPAIVTKVPPKTVVSFRISRNGKISNIMLEKPSGNIVLDNSALGIIRALNNLGPLPAAYSGDSLGIHYTFIAENK